MIQKFFLSLRTRVKMQTFRRGLPVCHRSYSSSINCRTVTLGFLIKQCFHLQVTLLFTFSLSLSLSVSLLRVCITPLLWTERPQHPSFPQPWNVLIFTECRLMKIQQESLGQVPFLKSTADSGYSGRVHFRIMWGSHWRWGKCCAAHYLVWKRMKS